jgi:hypothetical protein
MFVSNNNAKIYSQIVLFLLYKKIMIGKNKNKVVMDKIMIFLYYLYIFLYVIFFIMGVLNEKRCKFPKV